MDKVVVPDVISQELYLYAVWDKVARRLMCLHLNTSDGSAIRFFVTHYGYNGEDFARSEPLCFGRVSCDIHNALEMETYDSCQKGYSDVNFTCPRVLDWTMWKEPESKESLLDPLGLSPAEKQEAVANSISNLARRNSERAKVQEFVDSMYNKE